MPTIEQRVVGEMEVVDLGRQDHRRVSTVFFLEGPERLDVRPARSQDVHEVLVQSTVVIRGDHPNLGFCTSVLIHSLTVLLCFSG